MDFFTDYNFAIAPNGMTVDAARIYTQHVTNVLSWIYRVTTGRTLFNAIRFHAQPVTISPWTGATCNSTGGSTGSPRTGVVSYSPDIFVHGSCASQMKEGNTATFTRDGVLFHEFVHVLRSISGKWHKVGLDGGLTYYDDTEEFFAVVVTNIYASDQSNPTRTKLRGEHGDFSDLEPEFREPFTFFSAGTQAAPLIKQLIQDNHGFAIRIANDVKAKFNPIADYIADPDRCDRLSRDARKFDTARFRRKSPDLARLLDLLN